MIKLKDEFYKVLELKKMSENQILAIIEINREHDIYKGHFPNQPIVPGVCQIQIVKELLEELIGKKLQMTHGDNIKFTGMIIPDQTPVVNLEVNFKMNGLEIICDAKLSHGETTFTKYKGKFLAI
jgi:3-hydroxyacyl-[acyl-carrier-protein] dehydratase